MTWSNEIWKPVAGYEGLYEVSNTGRVKSTPRCGTKGRILKQNVGARGYARVELSKGNRQKKHFVHRLVASAFIGPIPDGLQVNHIDENKLNNRADNLNFMTAKENINWGSGRKKCEAAHRKRVACFGCDGTIIAEYQSITEAARATGASLGGISECCHGKREKLKGVIYKFVEAGR